MSLADEAFHNTASDSTQPRRLDSMICVYLDTYQHDLAGTNEQELYQRTLEVPSWPGPNAWVLKNCAVMAATWAIVLI